MTRHIIRIALLACCTALIASCAAETWPESKGVTYDELTDQCVHNGTQVVFTSEHQSTYDACFDLANASAEGTLVFTDGAQSLESETSKLIVICSEYCECTPGGCTCTGPVCIAY